MRLADTRSVRNPSKKAKAELYAGTGALGAEAISRGADAVVYVDGRARGTGNTTLNLSSSPKRIEVKKADGGYMYAARIR